MAAINPAKHPTFYTPEEVDAMPNFNPLLNVSPVEVYGAIILTDSNGGRWRYVSQAGQWVKYKGPYC